ncbi:hypothetical protein H9P43_009510 [Blastocladiella emersonii ATCC 22665]|nr:hypothetical protein H9P43_009510 [Blastocladiella emersonii ATCC 22665]
MAPPPLPAQRDPNDYDAILAGLNHELLIETKIKIGAENMLQVSHSGTKGTTVPQQDVLAQLSRTNQRIAELSAQVDYYEHLKQLKENPVGNLSI